MSRRLLVASAFVGVLATVTSVGAQAPALGTVTMRFTDSHSDKQSAVNGCQSTDESQADEATITLTSARKTNSVSTEYKGRAKVSLKRSTAVHWTPKKGPCKTVDSNGKEIWSPPPSCFVEGGGWEMSGGGDTEATITVSVLNGKYFLTWELGEVPHTTTFTAQTIKAGKCAPNPPRSEVSQAFGYMHFIGSYMDGVIDPASGARIKGGFSKPHEFGGTFAMEWDLNAGPPPLSVDVEGCTELGVGKAGKIEATASEEGGRFSYRVEPAGIITVAGSGSTATLTAVKQGEATLYVTYTSPKGEKVEASHKVSALQLLSINNNQPVQIGLHDVLGEPQEAIRKVKLAVQPAGAGTRLQFNAANGEIVNAETAINDELILQGLEVGSTTVQAETSCGLKVGPPIAVKVVPCDDEVIAKLRAKEKELMARMQRNIQEITQLTADPDFDRAAREGADHIRELGFKTITLISKLAATGTASDLGGKYLPEVIDKIDDLETAAEIANKTMEGSYQEAANKTAELVADKTFDYYTDSGWGVVKNLVEAGQLAQKVGEDLGEVAGTADRLAELERITMEIDAELKIVHGLLINVCKKQPPPKPKPAPPQAKPDPKDPAPKPTKVTAKGAPPKQLDVKEVPADEQPAEGTEIVEPPREPAPPKDRTGLLTDEQESQCTGWSPVRNREEDVFGTLAGNVRAVQQSVQTFKSATLDPLAAHAEALRETFADMKRLRSLSAADQATLVGSMRERLAAHNPASLTDFSAQIIKFEAEVASCAPALQNSFEVKIEELSTRY